MILKIVFYLTPTNVLFFSCSKQPLVRKYPRECDDCGQIYGTRQKFYVHKKSCAITSKTSKALAKKPCIHPGCTEVFFHTVSMIKHLKDVHLSNIDIVEETFTDISEFKIWKEKVECKSCSSFTACAGAKTLNDRKYSYYTCQFDLRNKSHRKTGEPYRKGKTSKKWKKVKFRRRNFARQGF